MLVQLLVLVASCVPQPNRYCTRELRPVCAEGVTYNNLCRAQAAGYYGECANKVTQGVCGSISTKTVCGASEFLNEDNVCVPKPWDDFESCEIEKNQGACPGGNDPNTWVAVNCAKTCGISSSQYKDK
jgi:hypothetical protein